MINEARNFDITHSRRCHQLPSCTLRDELLLSLIAWYTFQATIDARKTARWQMFGIAIDKQGSELQTL